jgi:hypothetical protein
MQSEVLQMSDRVEFQLNPKQLERLLAACKPVPYLVVNDIEPTSPREKAIGVWQELGKEMGFEWSSAQAVPGKDQSFFSAYPKASIPDDSAEHARRASWAAAPPEWFVEHVAQMRSQELGEDMVDDAKQAAFHVMRHGARLLLWLKKGK